MISIMIAALASEASGQSCMSYDSAGKVTGRSTTDSQGTVTNYDSRDRVISRGQPVAARRRPMMRAG